MAPGLTFPRYYLRYGEVGQREAVTFFERMPDWFDVRGRSVLDVGCGLGALCMETARRGARRVLGVDTGQDGIRFAQWRLSQEEGSWPVEFRAYDGDPAGLAPERFDVLVSKDSFERYSLPGSVPDAETMADRMAERLEIGGLLAMRLGPLWKTPFGAHIESRLPWAHLIFPEAVIFEHYRRVRPPGKTARTFEEGVGVNRMTLADFRRVMDTGDLERLYMGTNVGRSRALKAVSALARVPGLEEFFTQNVYGVWRLPSAWRPRTAGAT